MPSSNDTTKNADRRCDEQADKEQPMTNPLTYIWNHAVKGKSTAWQAISAVIMAVVTILLWRVGSATNELAQATQRALISFAGTGPGPSMTSQDHKIRLSQEVLFNWSNSGTTQARNAITTISGEAWPTELPQEFDFPDLQGSQIQTIAIGPKEIDSVRAQIPINQIATTWEGKSHLYAWGWIVYDDVFRTPPHLTEFCVEFMQITIPGGKSSSEFPDPSMNFGWNIQKCKQHNCY